jgi:S-adenosyl-L-methionine hydrolase (adenosine-forming)
MPDAARPLVTLTTDFGMTDAYVAVMKAALLAWCPQARLIDVTHQVPRHDILCGSITLERAVDGFPVGSLHLCVVDPGVGTARRMLVARAKGQTVVCPDNGLITWTFHRHPRVETFELIWRPGTSSNTFHGRDVMAPTVGMLAGGAPVESIAKPLGDPVLLDVKPARAAADPICVIHLDAFGNATTNVSLETLKALGLTRFCWNGIDLGPLQRTYWDVAPGKALALIGSSGLLEIAVRDGSAAEALGVRVGDTMEAE